MTADHRQLTHRQILGVVFCMCFAVFLPMMEQTAIGPALPAIARDLNLGAAVAWVSSIYLLAMTTTIPLMGKLSDIHGRRTIMLTSLLIFTVGSLWCAVAVQGWQLIVARAIQGVGGGGMLSTSHTIVADIVAPLHRGRYMVYTGSVGVVATMLGPVVATWCVNHATWSVLFWINVPVGAIAYVVTRRVLSVLPRRERPHQLDVLGAVWFLVFTLAALLALTWIGEDHGWSARRTVVATCTAVIALALFARQLRRSAEPFVDPAIFTHPVVSPAILAGAVTMATLSGLLFSLPSYFASMPGATLERLGLALAPLAMGMPLGSMITARWAARVKHYRFIPVAGLTAAIGGLVTIALVPGMPLYVLVVFFGFLSLAVGSVLVVVTLCIQNSVQPHRLGTALAAMTFSRSFGSAIFVTLVGVLIASAFSTQQSLTHETIRPVFYASAVMLFFAILALLRMEHRPLSGIAGSPALER